MVAVMEVGVVVIKTLVWAESVFDMLAEVLISVVVDVVAIALGFDVAAPYSLDVLPDVAVDLPMDTLVVVIIGVPPGIGVNVLADVNVFAVVMTVNFPMSAPPESFSS